MKGLLLAGGHGTRLRPLTFTGNKHMLPIANQPMLFYGLRHLADAGIREVGIVLGPFREGIEETVGDGARFGLHVTYVEQGPPRGLADAVRCGRQFLGDEPFVMYLGDNLLQQGAAPLVRAYREENPDAVIGVTELADPRPYGVVELDGERIVSIVEKPPAPKSHLALVGVYLFTSAIHPVVERLTPSSRGELEITEAIWRLHSSGGKVLVRHVEGWWKDTGKPEDLLEANERVLRSLPGSAFSREGLIDSSAQLRGSVAVGAGSVIGPNSVLEGPLILGRNVRVEEGGHVGPATAVGDGVVIRKASVVRSIVLEGAELVGPVALHDSIVGRRARIRVEGSARLPMTCVLGDATELTL